MFGPFDEEFDVNNNGIMEDEEKAAEAAYIHYIAEKDSENENGDDDTEISESI